MEDMTRAAALLLLGALTEAGTDFHEVDAHLWPRGVEYELTKPAAEVHLVLAFKRGLYTIAGDGVAPAGADLLVEYNDADRSTCYWNRYRPLPFDEASNPEWIAGDAPGVFATDGATTDVTGRTLVVRLPRVNRWRIRVTPLAGDTELARRVPALVAVAELPDAAPREFEELDPLEPPEELVELPGEEVEEPVEAEEPPDEPVAEPIEVVAVAPACCPFCFTPFPDGCVKHGGNRHYRCGSCPGAVHYRGDGGRFCSKDGKTFTLGRGRKPTLIPAPQPVSGAPRAFTKQAAFGPNAIVPGAPRPFTKPALFGPSVIVPGAPRAFPTPVRAGGTPRPFVVPPQPPSCR
jgi:hypothetical protein